MISIKIATWTKLTVNKLNYNSIKFLKSDLDIRKQSFSKGLEVAFLGYSNSGKSSIINVLSSRKKK